MNPILVTGAAGRVGGIGNRVVKLLLGSGLPVRALVRQDDERATNLRNIGAEVVVADLTKPDEVLQALHGCRRVFFCTSVSSSYLEATAVMAAAAKANNDIELLVNMSQMTLSKMDISHTAESPQHRQQWLSEQVLNWSGVPVVHLRPTVFQENFIFLKLAAKSILDSGTIRLPFGRKRSNPVAAKDVAEVAAAILLEPEGYAGKVVELTGPRPIDMYQLAQEYSEALGRSIQYVEVPLQAWEKEELKDRKDWFSDHVYQHLFTMIKLHATGEYDLHADSTKTILGRPATRILATIRDNRSLFTPSHDPVPSS